MHWTWTLPFLLIGSSIYRSGRSGKSALPIPDPRPIWTGEPRAWLNETAFDARTKRENAMGTWGAGTLDNDTAVDWMYGLGEVSDLSLIEGTLDRALALGGEYLEAP